MDIKVQFYGVLEQTVGDYERHLNIRLLHPSVRDALDVLIEQLPQLRAHLGRCACAVGDAIVPRDRELRAGDTLVLLPPVGGG